MKTGWIAVARNLPLAALLLVTACGDRNVTLAYAALPASATQNIPQRGAVVVEPFTDERPDKSVIGAARNTYYMRAADAVTTSDIGRWATDALKIELTRSGYRVVAASGATQDMPRISGRVTEVNCDSYLTYDGTVTFAGVVKAGQTELLQGIYSARGNGGGNLVGDSPGFARCLNDALGKALQIFLADLAAKNIAQQ